MDPSFRRDDGGAVRRDRSVRTATGWIPAFAVMTIKREGNTPGMFERDQRGPAIRLSGEFHLQLAEMAGNAPLAHFLGSLVPLTSLAIAQFDAQAEGYCVWQTHEGILDAVERGDAVMAETLLSQHLGHLEEILLNPKPISRQNRVAG